MAIRYDICGQMLDCLTFVLGNGKPNTVRAPPYGFYPEEPTKCVPLNIHQACEIGSVIFSTFTYEPKKFCLSGLQLNDFEGKRMINIKAEKFQEFACEKKVLTIKPRETIVSVLVHSAGWNVPTQITFILFREPEPVVEEKAPEFYYGK